MNHYTFRFANPQLAKNAARALRRRGLTVRRAGNDVTVCARDIARAHTALRAWALYRGSLPTVMLINF